MPHLLNQSADALRAWLTGQGEREYRAGQVRQWLFEKRAVTLGMEQKGRVQVLEGLKPGERVVTEGSFILKSEMLKGELGEE